MKWVNTTEIGHFVISIVRNDSEMTEMTEFVKFGMNQHVLVPEIMDFRHETSNSHKSRKTSTFWRTGKQCDISV